MNFTIVEEYQNSDVFKGMNIVVSGKFNSLSRDEIKKVIQENGGKVISSVSSKTDLLVAGENMGPSKLEKANKFKSSVTLFGPVRPIMERLKGFERHQIFLQAKSRSELQNLLKPWIKELRSHPMSNRVKWSIDVDPIEF